MAETKTRETPVELGHARRHLDAAESDWKAGKLPATAAHLREGLTNAAWALYELWASEHADRESERSE